MPRASFFHAIRHFSPQGTLEREKLDEYCTADAAGEGADEMFEYAQRVRRTIVEVLDEFSSVQFDLKWLCEVVPWMKERQFSIASDPNYLNCSPTRLQLAVAIVKYKTRLREPRCGVCTSWFANLPIGSEVPYRIAKGSLRLPPKSETPVIYIGPGTGVAPMHAFLQQRFATTQTTEEDGFNGKQDAPPNRIYLGYRHSQKDFLFESDWRRWSDQGRLEWRLAASRESTDGTKVYVQDRMVEDGEFLWREMGERGAYVLISGSAGKMPEAVRAALQQACVTHGGMDEDQARRYLAIMEAQGRLQEECWN